MPPPSPLAAYFLHKPLDSLFLKKFPRACVLKRVRADGIIICGDFNMTPDSALYHYMVNGELDLDGLNW